MGLGPTLVGAVIGAVVGMGLHLLVETTTSFEAAWFAIIIGVLTGLGVNQANKSLTGRVSYLRGAIAAAIALAAIVGSPMVIAQVLANDNTQPPAAAKARDGEATDETAPDDATAVEDGRPAELPVREGVRGAAVSGGTANQTLVRPGEFSVWQFVFMAVGTFIAYEFGRGTAKAGNSTPPEPVQVPISV